MEDGRRCKKGLSTNEEWEQWEPVITDRADADRAPTAGKIPLPAVKSRYPYKNFSENLYTVGSLLQIHSVHVDILYL